MIFESIFRIKFDKIYVYCLLFNLILEKYLFLKYSILTPKSMRRFHLEIAILSSRENLEKRLTIRNTWFKNIQSHNDLFSSAGIPFRIGAHFVLGSHSCPIHPLNRKNFYDCDEQLLCSVNDTSLTKTFLFTQHRFKHYQETNQVFKGFSFMVYHTILINKIGIFSTLVDRLKIVNLQVFNALNKIKLHEYNISYHNELIDGFYYKNVHVSLETGSTLIVMIVDEQNIYLKNSFKTNFNNAKCVLEILRSYYGFYDHESVLFENDSHSFYVNFEFQIQDVNRIQNKVNRFKSNSLVWLRKLEDLKKRLTYESETHGDLIFVNMMDIYRNLPRKLKLYFQRFIARKKEVTHILKTDDDCYLNISGIVQLITLNLDKKFVWFGNFRKMWPVNYYGKWAENDYNEPFYPMFACGSGYVLTRDIVDWIINNSNYLFHYQGEDVSLGIWLSSINPHKIQNNRWVCGNENEMNFDSLLSAPQIDNQTMFRMQRNG